jgi:hypothetical protein
MAAQDKVIGGIVVAHSLLGISWIWAMTAQHGFAASFVVSNIVLALFGLVAGIAYIRRVHWAALLVMLFLAVQLVHVFTPGFHFSFTLGFHLVISGGWFGKGQVGINLFALALLAWVIIRAIAGRQSPARVSEAT